MPYFSRRRSVTRRIAGAAVLLLAMPCQTWACDGIAGRSVAVTFDGQKYTVSNTGHQWLQVTFTAWNNTYNLQLAPGQSASPRSPGTFGQFMSGYQSCAATPIRYKPRYFAFER
jgi:hypothetical protein